MYAHMGAVAVWLLLATPLLPHSAHRQYVDSCMAWHITYDIFRIDVRIQMLKYFILPFRHIDLLPILMANLPTLITFLNQFFSRLLSNQRFIEFINSRFIYLGLYRFLFPFCCCHMCLEIQ